MLSTNCTSENFALSFPVTLPGLTSGRLEFYLDTTFLIKIKNKKIKI
jgi:hypothetical protein